MMREIVLGCVLVATLGCSIDLVGAPTNTPAHIISTISVRDSGALELLLNARFSPGTDDDGLPRRLADENLRTVAGVLAPVLREDDGTFRYESDTVDVETLDSLVAWVEPPDVPGTVNEPPRLAIPLIVRAGEDSLLLAQGADALFALAGVPDSMEGVRWAWVLALAATDSGPGISIGLSNSGLPPPAGVTVSANLLTAFGGREAVAELLVVGDIRPPPSAADYFASLSVRTFLRWAIRVEN